MKVKLRLDKKAVQEFLLQHTEKVVLGVMAVCFLLIVYGALGHESFSKTPDDLKNTAISADSHISGTSKPEVPIPKFHVASLNPDDLVQKYAIRRINEPVMERKGGRPQPVVLAVEKLRAVGGMGRFNVSVDPGAPRQATAARGERGMRFVILTGLVPRKKQLLTYQETFQSCAHYDPAVDVPNYVLPAIERAEAVAGSDPSALTWQPVDLVPVFKRMIAEGTTGDVVEEHVVQKYLTLPLPKRLDASETQGAPAGTRYDWGEEAACPPEIPYGVVRAPEARVEQKSDASEDPAFFGSETTPTTAPAKPQPAVADKVKSDEYYLLRFIDFTVEPGKAYRYRVRLQLINPNYAQKAEVLEKPELAKDRTLWTTWTELSQPVGVPRDTRVLAGGVAPLPAGKLDQEPKATLMIVKWVEATGAEAFKEEVFWRGSVVNSKASGGTGTKPARPAEGENDLGLLGGAKAAPESHESGAVDFVTDAVVVDIRGGQNLPGRIKLNAPGEILTADANGILSLCSEMSDRHQYEQRKRGSQGPSIGAATPLTAAPAGGLDELSNGKAPAGDRKAAVRRPTKEKDTTVKASTTPKKAKKGA